MGSGGKLEQPESKLQMNNKTTTGSHLSRIMLGVVFLFYQKVHTVVHG